MSVRTARLEDHWRHVLSRTYPTRIDNFSFQRLRGLADGTLDFSPGITAIVGGNGVGKSTLAGAICEIISNRQTPDLANWSEQLSGSLTHASTFVHLEERALSISQDPTGERRSGEVRFDGEFRWLDPSDLAH
jgi:recombinational DNA repair ATPase RecF